MKRMAVIVKLKPGAGAQAAELLEQGPPFDLQSLGFQRHAVYTVGDEAVFVFEGGRLDELMGSVAHMPEPSARFKAWEPLLDGMPQVAQEAFFWQRDDEPDGWGE
jgi:hypothetical protein